LLRLEREQDGKGESSKAADADGRYVHDDLQE
jgi:hypothetical protein